MWKNFSRSTSHKNGVGPQRTSILEWGENRMLAKRHGPLGQLARTDFTRIMKALYVFLIAIVLSTNVTAQSSFASRLSETRFTYPENVNTRGDLIKFLLNKSGITYSVPKKLFKQPIRKDYRRGTPISATAWLMIATQGSGYDFIATDQFLKIATSDEIEKARYQRYHVVNNLEHMSLEQMVTTMRVILSPELDGKHSILVNRKKRQIVVRTVRATHQKVERLIELIVCYDQMLNTAKTSENQRTKHRR